MSQTDSTSHGTAYTPRQVYVAAFLGTPLAAAWFVRKNFLLAGAPARASTAMWRGIVLTTAVFVLAYFLPERTPNILLPLAYSVLIYIYAQSVFDKPVKLHLESGGRRGSWWEVIGIGIATMALVVILAFAVIYLLATIGIVTVDASDA
jgi:hypothetical protein